MADTLLDRMEVHLLAWGVWLQGGKRGDGYPTKSVLHQSWLPPTPGMVPTMRVSTTSDRVERALHAAIQQMSVRMQNTLVVVYVMRAGPVEQGVLLDCSAVAIRNRLVEAKRRLARCV